MKQVTLALPKGTMFARSRALAERLTGETVSDRRLRVTGSRWDVVFLKHRDIPRLIGHGIDVGITSSEWLRETTNRVDVVAKLTWCDARISVIGYGQPPAPQSRGAMEQLGARLGRSLRCVTEFGSIAATHLAEFDVPIELTLVSGSTEALVPRPFDLSIDCVETGATLAANGLMEWWSIIPTAVVLVSAPKSKGLQIGELQRALMEEQ